MPSAGVCVRGEAGNRTPLPGSRPAMLTKATSRSESRESNPAFPGPKPGGAPCTSTPNLRKALESNQSAKSATRLAVERRDHTDFAFHGRRCLADCLRAQGRGRTGTSLRTQFLRLVCIPVPPPERHGAPRLSTTSPRERRAPECEWRELNPHHQFGRLGSWPLDDTRKSGQEERGEADDSAVRVTV